MGKALILGKDTKHLDKDIELCRTTNERISDQAAQLLIENQIPFTRSFIKIPFFLREKYRGAHQFYVIHTNRNRYSQARHTLDHMDSVFRRRTCTVLSSDDTDLPLKGQLFCSFITAYDVAVADHHDEKLCEGDPA